MNILVINGSPGREKSSTLALTKAFLEGMGETAEFINTIDLDITPCRACFSCWIRTEGQCVVQDDALPVLEKIRNADLVIWSVPLYCYGAPSHCKALMDRTMCFNEPDIYVGDDGRSHHIGYEDGSKKTVLISSGGLPDMKGNFDGLIFQFRHMFGNDTTIICCAEGALLANVKTRPLTASYVETIKAAGKEYKENGRITENTQNKLDGLMIPRDEYIRNTNQAFRRMKEKHIQHN